MVGGTGGGSEDSVKVWTRERDDRDVKTATRVIRGCADTECIAHTLHSPGSHDRCFIKVRGPSPVDETKDVQAHSPGLETQIWLSCF